MGYPRYESNRAMHAANFNLNTAMSYLRQGIPEPAVQQSVIRQGNVVTTRISYHNPQDDTT